MHQTLMGINEKVIVIQTMQKKDICTINIEHVYRIQNHELEYDIFIHKVKGMTQKTQILCIKLNS
jgi:hypothetical protein